MQRSSLPFRGASRGRGHAPPPMPLAGVAPTNGQRRLPDCRPLPCPPHPVQRANIDWRPAPPKRSNLLAKLVGAVGRGGSAALALSGGADASPDRSMGSADRACRSASRQPRTVWKSEPDVPAAAAGANVSSAGLT
eukprot:scaffold2529_cov122-Isochrysis_galbana.AAC.15